MADPPDLRVQELEIAGERYLVFSHALGPGEGRRALTSAERDVLHLLEEGLSDREIQARRRTTRGTLTKQIDRIFRKLGVSSRRELLARPR